MALTLGSLQRSGAPKPPRILIHGVEGIGKTTWAAAAPKPVFIWCEEGAGSLEVDGFPLAKTFDEVLDAIECLLSEQHDFQTVVVDSVDWLERMVWKYTCDVNGWDSIEKPDYGKGYVAAMDVWQEYLAGMNALREERNMTVIQIAHTAIRPFHSPESEPYDRYEIKLHKRASEIMRELSDVVLFANYQISTINKEGSVKRKTARAVGGGDARQLHCNAKPAFLAKNRYGLPDSIPLKQPPDGWSEFAQYVPWFNQVQQQQDAA